MPSHEIIRDKKTIDEILEKCNCNINQLPVIINTDVMAKLNRMVNGE